MELIIPSSLIFSIVAMGLSLARIVRWYREGKRKRQSDLFSNITNITRIIEDEKFVQSRRALRKNKLLNQLREENGNDNLVFELDMATEDTARNVASTYDRLGFILKHDKRVGRWIYPVAELCYCRYVVTNKRSHNQKVAVKKPILFEGIWTNRQKSIRYWDIKKSWNDLSWTS